MPVVFGEEEGLAADAGLADVMRKAERHGSHFADHMPVLLRLDFTLTVGQCLTRRMCHFPRSNNLRTRIT